MIFRNITFQKAVEKNFFRCNNHSLQWNLENIDWATFIFFRGNAFSDYDTSTEEQSLIIIFYQNNFLYSSITWMLMVEVLRQSTKIMGDDLRYKKIVFKLYFLSFKYLCLHINLKNEFWKMLTPFDCIYSLVNIWYLTMKSFVQPFSISSHFLNDSDLSIGIGLPCFLSSCCFCSTKNPTQWSLKSITSNEIFNIQI